MLTTLTIKPVRYLPFKTRVFRSIVATICFFDVQELFFLAIGYFKGFDKYVIVGFPILIVLFIPLFILSEVWVLDSVVLDSARKTIRVKTRRLDKLIDKGEQDINNGLKITTYASSYRNYVSNTVFVPSRLLIRRGWKIIWVQYVGLYNVTDCWTYQLFNQIKTEANKIQEAPEAVVNYNDSPLNPSETSF